MSRNRFCVVLLWMTSSFAACAGDLAAAYAAATVRSLDLLAAQAAVEAAREGANVARAQLLPQVALQLNQNQLRQTTIRATGRESFAGNAYNHELSLRQGLWREKGHIDVQIATVQVSEAEFELQKVQSSLWQRVAEAWVDACMTDLKAHALARAVDATEGLAFSAGKRFERGEFTVDAVAEARARASLARSRLSEAREDTAIALRTLSTLTGSSLMPVPLESGSGTGEFTVRSTFVMPSPAYVVAQNPALNALRQSEVVAQRRVAKADAEHRPTVDLVGSVTRSENDSSNGLGAQYRSARIGLQASIPLVSGGGTVAQVRRATHDARGANLRREAGETETALAVENAAQRYRSLAQRRDALVETLHAAQLMLESARRNAAAGQKSNDSVLEAFDTQASRVVELLSATTGLLKLEIQILAKLRPTDPLVLQWSDQLGWRLAAFNPSLLAIGLTP